MLATQPAIDQNSELITMVINGLTSDNSRRAYATALAEFITWYESLGRPELCKKVVQDYKVHLQSSGLAASTINLKLSAVRKLFAEAADNQLMDRNLADSIMRVAGVKTAGVRSGNWLSLDQAQDLLELPDSSTLAGVRNTAILAVMLGCGLRRSEVANLNVDDIQQRDGRWAIVDIVGKGNRVRTVPMPSWAKSSVDDWLQAANVTEGRIFRAINKSDKLAGQRISKNGIMSDGAMTPQAIANLVDKYSKTLGVVVAAHDLRRTYAKLAHKGGSGLDQIQLSLGHASIQTTERYLGVTQDFNDAPCDRLGLRL